MYKDRYKVFESPKKKQFVEMPREQSKEFLSKPSGSPKKKYHSPQFTRKSYFDEQQFQQNNDPQPAKVQHKLNCEKDARLSALIYEAISSADRVVKQILNYNVPQLEPMCSKYFLGKQKLYSYLHTQSIPMSPYKSKISKLTKYKSRKEDNTPEEKEEVSLQQLRRLQGIVQNKIVPLLKEQLYKERRRFSKIKRQIQIANPEQREGMYLLQKLNTKGKKFNLDDYIEVLEKYIVKVMDKENDLMDKVNELQIKLQKQIQKVEEYENFIKKRQEEKHQDDIQRANQLKRMVRYQDFVKTIQSIVKDEQQNYFVKETQNLDSLAQRIRKILKEDENQKKEKQAIRRVQSVKQLLNESENSRSQKLIKMKELVRTLNNQIGSLKQQCQNLQEKVRTNSQDIASASNKQKKLLRQNQSFCFTIQRLTEEITMLNKTIEQNLATIGKYEEDLVHSSENYNKLQQEKEKQAEENKRQQQENEKLLKHIVEIQDRYRQLSELQDKKDREYEEIIQSLYTKQVQIKQLSQGLERYQKQLKMVNSALIEREELIFQLQQKIKTTQQQANKLSKQVIFQQVPEVKTQADKQLEVNKQNGEHEHKQPQQKEKTENYSVTQAVVIDNQFIDKSEPNHKRQDYIPGKRFMEFIEEPVIINAQDLPQKIISELSSQKENNYEGQQKNLQKNDKIVGGIIGLQSDKNRPRKQSVNLIKIEEENVKQNIEKTDLLQHQIAYNEQSPNSQTSQNVNYEEEVLKTNKHLRQQVLKLLSNSVYSHSNQQIDKFNHQLQKIQNTLQKYAKNTTQKLKKLEMVELQNKVALKEIQYLRSKLQAANMKNQFVSNIPSESEGQGSSLDGQLRQILKEKTPRLYNNLAQKYSQFLYEENLKNILKVETGVQTEAFRVDNFYQSQVFRYLPQIKRILSKQQMVNQTINQSLIDQLELFNSDRFHKSMKIQRLQSPLLDDQAVLHASSPQKQNQQKEQVNQNLKKARCTKIQNSVKDIVNLMNYHKQQLLNLHLLLKKTTNGGYSKIQEVKLTPFKKPLIEHSQFIEQITQAPEKVEQRQILEAQEQMMIKKFELSKLNESPINKQQVYELMALQKQEEIAKLRQVNQELSKKLESNDKLYSEFKQLEIKFNMLMSFNQELKRQVAFLQTKQQKKMLRDSDQDLLNDAQSQEKAEVQLKQPQNFHKSTLEEQLNNKMQEAEQAGPKVSQNAKNNANENEQSPQNKAQQANQSPQTEFTWKDLIPEYFGHRCGQQK